MTAAQSEKRLIKFDEMWDANDVGDSSFNFADHACTPRIPLRIIPISETTNNAKYH